MGKLVGDRWIDERHIFVSAFAITVFRGSLRRKDVGSSNHM